MVKKGNNNSGPKEAFFELKVRNDISESGLLFVSRLSAGFVPPPVCASKERCYDVCLLMCSACGQQHATASTRLSSVNN